MADDNYAVYFMQHVAEYGGLFSPWQCACEWEYAHAAADEVEAARQTLWDYFAYATDPVNQERAREGDETMMLNEWPIVHHTEYYQEWLESIGAELFQ